MPLENALLSLIFVEMIFSTLPSSNILTSNTSSGLRFALQSLNSSLQIHILSWLSDIGKFYLFENEYLRTREVVSIIVLIFILDSSLHLLTQSFKLAAVAPS